MVPNASITHIHTPNGIPNPITEWKSAYDHPKFSLFCTMKTIEFCDTVFVLNTAEKMCEQNYAENLIKKLYLTWRLMSII